MQNNKTSKAVKFVIDSILFTYWLYTLYSFHYVNKKLDFRVFLG